MLLQGRPRPSVGPVCGAEVNTSLGYAKCEQAYFLKTDQIRVTIRLGRSWPVSCGSSLPPLAAVAGSLLVFCEVELARYFRHHFLRSYRPNNTAGQVLQCNFYAVSRVGGCLLPVDRVAYRVVGIARAAEDGVGVAGRIFVQAEYVPQNFLRERRRTQCRVVLCVVHAAMQQGRRRRIRRTMST